jgi:hypothetical protein
VNIELPLPYFLDSTRKGQIEITGIAEDRLLLSGTSNYNRPAQEWADKMAALSDEEFTGEAAEAIYWSAWADNNPTSDYHYQASVCYYEAQRRENPDLYQQAYDRAREHAGL